MAVQKIAILGGGPAALSTAFRLTSQPGWQERYSITLYQMGWRLGGKCATGRLARDHHRIQEHGIHLAGNFYSNLFYTMRDAYAELYGPDGTQHPDEAIRTLDRALIPNSYSLATEYLHGSWHLHDVEIPHNDEIPWEADWHPNLGALAHEIVGLIASAFERHHKAAEPDAPKAPRHHPSLWRKMIADPLVEMGLHKFVSLVDTLVGHAEQSHKDHTLAIEIVKTLDGLLEGGWDHLGTLADLSPKAEWIWMQVDFYTALLHGVIADEIFEKGISRIDHLSYRSWLRMHGAKERTLDSPLAQTTCNICFQYEGGDTTRLPNMSAAAFVMFTVRLILSPGMPMWFFRAGTGDTMIAPLYRVLRDRGVEFAFFHKVEALQVGPDGKTLESVVCQKQARPIGGTKAYDPLYELEFETDEGARRLLCWPGEPLFDRLEEGEELRRFVEAKEDLVPGPAPDPPHDLESYWCPTPPGAERVTLEHGRDFDFVVMGLSIAAIPVVAPSLVQAHPTLWEPALHHGQSVATQQVQYWFKKSLEEMGWDPDRAGGGSNRLVGPTFNQPTADFCDFSDLIDWEKWPAGGAPKSLLYFCGPIQDPPDELPYDDSRYPQHAHQRGGWEAAAHLRTAIGPILPAARANPADQQGLDFYLLHPARGGGQGVNRIWTQYLRLNIDPTERYVLSLPGSFKHRLKAWTSGVDNLFLTGDWIDTGLNVGSFEAAVMSGMLASYALTGSPQPEEIAGYEFMNPDAPRVTDYPLAPVGPEPRDRPPGAPARPRSVPAPES